MTTTMMNYTVAEMRELGSEALRAVASQLKIKNYTKFSKVVLLDLIIANQTKSIAAQNQVSVEQPAKEAKERAPKAGTKSEIILAELLEGKKSMYRIAKDNETYVSVVLNVKRRYIVR